ncbi:MAG: Ig-like domain-containing protein [Propionibacteriaceae bacterium]|nr:Ig-like domain-containing protein [Propionibacteriaceae bacterium]
MSVGLGFFLPTAADPIVAAAPQPLDCQGLDGVLAVAVSEPGAVAESDWAVCQVAGVPALNLAGALVGDLPDWGDVTVRFYEAPGLPAEQHMEQGQVRFGPWFGHVPPSDWAEAVTVPAEAVEVRIAARAGYAPNADPDPSTWWRLSGLAVQAGYALYPDADPPTAVTYGDVASWAFAVTPAAAQGTVTVDFRNIDGLVEHSAFAPLVDGQATVSVSGLGEGYYDVKATFRAAGEATSSPSWRSAVTVTPYGAEPRDPRFGLDTRLSWPARQVWADDRTAAPEAQLAAIGKAGIGAIRARLGVAEAYEGCSEWTDATPYQAVAEQAAALGIGVLQFFNDVVSCLRPGAEAGASRPPLDDDQLYEFGRAMAENMGDALDAVEYWNEPDTGYFLGYPYQYASGLKAFMAGVKAVRPDLTTLIAAPAPWTAPSRFFADVYANGVDDDFDVRNHHWHFGQPADLAAAVDSVAGLEQTGGVSGKAMWLTESGQPVMMAGGSVRASEIAQAYRLVQTYVSGFAAGYERVYYSSWQPLGDEGQSEWGITRGDQSPRPAYYALSLLTRHLAGTSVSAVLPHGPGGQTVYFTCDDPAAPGATCQPGEVRAVTWGDGGLLPGDAPSVEVFGRPMNAMESDGRPLLVSGLDEIPLEAHPVVTPTAPAAAAGAPLRLQVDRVEVDGVNQNLAPVYYPHLDVPAAQQSRIAVVLKVRDADNADVAATTAVTCAPATGFTLLSAAAPAAADGAFTCFYRNDLPAGADGTLVMTAASAAGADQAAVSITATDELAPPYAPLAPTVDLSDGEWVSGTVQDPDMADAAAGILSAVVADVESGADVAQCPVEADGTFNCLLPVGADELDLTVRIETNLGDRSPEAPVEIEYITWIIDWLVNTLFALISQLLNLLTITPL